MAFLAPKNSEFSQMNIFYPIKENHAFENFIFDKYRKSEEMFINA